MSSEQVRSTVDIQTTLREDVWRQFVDQCPQGNVFQTPEMFRVFAQAKGYRPNLWAAVGKDEIVQALFTPVQLTLLGGPLRALTTRFVAYGGILCESTWQGGKALKKLLTTFGCTAGRQALFTELRNLTDTSALQPVLQDCGFRYEDHLDYAIHLTASPDDVMQQIGPRTRKHIRQGLRRGDVQVREISSPKDLPVCYALLDRTYQLAGVPLADRSLFESAFDVLYPLGMCKFWLATVHDAPVATSVELLFKDAMYGWYGGLDRSYAEYLPGELLMWHILKWGAENGYRLYDFGGAGRPGESYGVRDFKAKFGGELVCYGRNTCVHSPWLYRVSTRGYDFLRRLRRWQSKQRPATTSNQTALAPVTGNDRLHGS